MESIVKYGFMLFLIFFISFSSFAENKQNFCFEEAGDRYGINPYLLYVIAKVESKLNPSALHKNKDGSYDIGLMQINSRWLPVLKRYGISKKDLFNPCQNVFVGAWVLSQCISKFGNTWKSIDCYNKGSKAKESSKYVWKIYNEYNKLFAKRGK